MALCRCDTLINHIHARSDGFLPDVCIFLSCYFDLCIVRFSPAEIAESERLGWECMSVQKRACVCFPHSWEGQSCVKCKFGRRDYNTKYSIDHDCHGPQCGVSRCQLVVARAVTTARAGDEEMLLCVLSKTAGKHSCA